MKRPSSKPSPRKKWRQQHPNYNQSDSLHKPKRPEQVILFSLRTGHNRLNALIHNKFKVGECEMCPCNADIMTAEHQLQHCRLHDAMRRDMWPEPTLLRDKLYGMFSLGRSWQDLPLTSQYVVFCNGKSGPEVLTSWPFVFY